MKNTVNSTHWISQELQDTLANIGQRIAGECMGMFLGCTFNWEKQYLNFHIRFGSRIIPIRKSFRSLKSTYGVNLLTVPAKSSEVCC